MFFKNKSGQTVVVKIPAGHVWLLGDNPKNSNDSRYYGAVPLGMLQGRIFLKIGFKPWPHICLVDTVIEDVKEVPVATTKKKLQEAAVSTPPVQTEQPVPPVIPLTPETLPVKGFSAGGEIEK